MKQRVVAASVHIRSAQTCVQVNRGGAEQSVSADGLVARALHTRCWRGCVWLADGRDLRVRFWE